MNKNTIASSIAEKLELMIAEGALKVGEKLPSERVLSDRLGVSRPSLREAKKILSSKGLLTTKQGGGSFVCQSLSPSLSDPLLDLLKQKAEFRYDILEVRRALESQAAYTAALRATDEDKQDIKEAFDKMIATHFENDPFKEARFDALFHISITKASHNVALLHIMKSLFEVLHASIKNNLDKLYTIPRVFEPLSNQHESLMNAILEGRAEDAQNIATEHLDFINNSIQEIDREQKKLERFNERLLILGDKK